MSKYRVLQLTNSDISTVTGGDYMPLGNITRRIQDGCGGEATFSVTTSDADTVMLNELGYYDITYSASLIAGAVGEVSVALIINGEELYEVGTTIGAVGDVANLTLPFQVRVCPSCSAFPNNCPMRVQVRLAGVEITSGKSNLKIERVY